MTTYMITDGNGETLTTWACRWPSDLGVHEARRVAQRLANERAESVYLSEVDEEEEEEIEPESMAVQLARATIEPRWAREQDEREAERRFNEK